MVLIISSIIILLVSGFTITQASSFDPLFSYDDGDSHRVSINSISKTDDKKDSQQKTVSSVKGSELKVSDIYIPLKIRDDSSLATPSLDESSKMTTLDMARSKMEPAKHWSALENYYKMLARARTTTVNPYQQQQPDIYSILQQDMDDRADSLGTYRVQPYRQTVLRDYSVPVTNRSPFQLPITSPRIVSTKGASDLNVAIYQQTTPGSNEGRPVGMATTKGAFGTNLNEYSPQVPITQDQDSSISRFIDSLVSSTSSPKISSDSNDGLVRYYESRKLADYIHLRKQQERARHQQDTLGILADQIRRLNQDNQAIFVLSDEAFCTPRNYVKHFPTVPGLNGLDSKTLQQRLAEISRVAGKARIDIPISLSAGEFPSHMGIYNGSDLNEDTFLCGATWIHESFALTLASCLQNVNLEKLTIRAGDWNLNRNKPSTTSTESPNVNSQPITPSSDMTMVTRNIKAVYIMPKYQPKTWDHNLAVVEFSSPIRLFDQPFIYPACQYHSRSSLKASSCWAPVRNVTKVNYFDADGDGETKERKIIKMVEVPINLINDDNQCSSQTKTEYFSYIHPNLICSGDLRNSDRRLRLNQTEYMGSGVYCDEGGYLSLVSILHPLSPVLVSGSSNTQTGYIDLSYYRPWLRKIIYGTIN